MPIRTASTVLSAAAVAALEQLRQMGFNVDSSSGAHRLLRADGSQAALYSLSGQQSVSGHFGNPPASLPLQHLGPGQPRGHSKAISLRPFQSHVTRLRRTDAVSPKRRTRLIIAVFEFAGEPLKSSRFRLDVPEPRRHRVNPGPPRHEAQGNPITLPLRDHLGAH
jgi:hypothetical protein